MTLQGKQYFFLAQIIPYSSQIFFVIAKMISKDYLLLTFAKTFERLDYIKYITFGVIFLVSIFTFCVITRYSQRRSQQFEEPINEMISFIDKINKFDNPYEENLDDYQIHFTCSEIKSLFESVTKIVSDIKFSNQVFVNFDDQSLLDLSKAKLFYSSQFLDLQGLGICCNNIGNIHFRQNRYYEAVAEYQEAIMAAKIEQVEIFQQMKEKKVKLRKIKREEPNLNLESSHHNIPVGGQRGSLHQRAVGKINSQNNLNFQP